MKRSCKIETIQLVNCSFFEILHFMNHKQRRRHSKRGKFLVENKYFGEIHVRNCSIDFMCFKYFDPLHFA